MNFFVLVDDINSSLIRRISVSADLQREITTYLQEQRSQFYINQEKIDFTGSYTVNEGEIFSIPNFTLEESITSALQNPLNYDLLDLSEENQKIKALFAGTWNRNEKFVYFQAMDSRRILAKKFTLFLSTDTYSKLDKPGIILQDHLSAIFENNELLFNSYHITRQFIDLSDYYREATDADLDSFAAHTLFQVENVPLFKKNSDSIIRKKIALLQKNRILDNIDLEGIVTVAQDYPTVSIPINNGKIVLPEDRKQLKELVRFLDEDYFTAPLTKRKCSTNSKRYI